MYIERVPNRGSRPTILLREGRREGHRVIKRTLANLSDWPDERVAVPLCDVAAFTFGIASTTCA